MRTMETTTARGILARVPGARPARTHRSALALLGAAATLAVAACGSSTAARTSATGTPSPQGQGRRGGAAGELVRITGSTLVLSTQNGDVTVTAASATPVTRTRTGTVADIVAGSCIIASGQKDAGGTLTASTVRLSPKVDGSCSGPGLFGNGGPNGAPTGGVFRTPNPDRTPPPGVTPPQFTRGEVTAVSGTSVTVRATDGSSSTITVPTTVQVAVSAPATFADLAVGDCVLATGPRSTSGTVAARSLNIVPAGPSGCFTGRGLGGFGGGRGGFGGGGGGGAGGGGGFGGPPPDGAPPGA